MSRFIIDLDGVVRDESDTYQPTAALVDAIKPNMLKIYVGKSFFDKLSDLWDKFVIKFKGKNVAVFGERAVGKTHLIQFLTTGSLPTEYKQTIGAQRTKSRRFPLRELNLSVKSTLDLPGGEGAYSEWMKVCDEADIVLYLLRADRLIAGDRAVEGRVRKDVQHISEWLDEREKQSSRPDFFIIGTHCDLDPEFRSASPETRGNYFDKFLRLQIVDELITLSGGARQANVVLGSMKTLEDTQELVWQIFAVILTQESS